MQKIVLLIMVLIFCLVGCNKNEVKSEIYKGKNLSIAVVGKTPEVREKNIDFKSLSLEEISKSVKEISNEFDAVFIMKEHLSEADDDKYVSTYKDLTIPTFFFETTKAHLPFVNEGVTYKTAPEVGENSYAVGYLYSGTKQKYKDDVWKFYLYNDVKNEVNIKDVYTNIFKTIESVSQSSNLK
jgi:hypothetical protein